MPLSSSSTPSSITGSGAKPKRAATRPRAQHLQFGYTYEEDFIEEELVPEKAKGRASSSAGGQGPSKKAKIKKTTVRAKNTPMNKIPLVEYSKLRDFDPYSQPKNTRSCNNPRFYTKDQERIFHEVYGPKKKRFCEMQAINTEHMDANPAYFGEAKAICEEFGLIPLMEFCHGFDEDLVAQFFATVKMSESEEGELTLQWMTHDKLLSATWEEFGECLGYPVLPANAPGYFRVHGLSRPMAKDRMVDAELYIPGWESAGSSYKLRPTYDILLRIYRSVLNPKVGNFDQVHGYLVNMMVLSATKKGAGQRLDVMDFLWIELHFAVVMRKTPPYAPYLMALMCKKWAENDGGDLMQQCSRILLHRVKTLPIKKHEEPRQPYGTVDADDDDSDYEVSGSKFKKWLGKLTARVKASWCFKVDLQDRMYDQHVQDKKSRKRQKEIMRKLDIPVSSGSEGRITPKEQWVSKQRWPESSNDSGSSQPPARDDEDEDEDDEDEEYEE